MSNEHRDTVGRTPAQIDAEIERLHREKIDLVNDEARQRKEREHAAAVEAGKELSALVQEYNRVEAEQMERLNELYRRVAATPGARRVVLANAMWNIGPGTPREISIRVADAMSRMPRHIVAVEVFGADVRVT